MMFGGTSFLGPLISVFTAGVLYVCYRIYENRSFFRDKPGPPHSWLWGHLKIMGEIAAEFPPNMHPQAYYTAIAKRYNLEGIWYLDMWPIVPPNVLLTDPELLDQVTVHKPLRQHQMAADFMGPILGYNVIAIVNGPIWKSLHNAMLPAFSWSHIRSLTDMMVDECLQFCTTLDNLASSGQVFSMEETSMKLIFDVIARIVFNVPLHAQTKGSRQLDDLREMVVLAENELDIASKYNPWTQLKLYFKRRAVLGRLHPFMYKKITERFNLLKQDQIVPSRKNPNSILDLMLREKIQAQENSSSGTKSYQLSSTEMQILTENIKGLLLGGHGTTTDSLCYIYMLLSKAPDVLHKLRVECDKIFAPTRSETVGSLLASPEKLQDLHYMDAVIKEALRLFPVGHGVRVADPGATLTYKGKSYPIDRNYAIAPLGHTIHYDPTFFPEPTKFSPERWLDPTNPIPRSYFRTFSRGPRGCLGVNLAMNELKIILLMTVREYDFECVGLKPNKVPRTNWTDLDLVFGDIVFQELGMEAKPRGGMMMRVKKRSA